MKRVGHYLCNALSIHDGRYTAIRRVLSLLWDVLSFPDVFWLHALNCLSEVHIFFIIYTMAMPYFQGVCDGPMG